MSTVAAMPAHGFQISNFTIRLIEESSYPVLTIPTENKFNLPKEILLLTNLNENNLALVYHTVSLFKKFDPMITILFFSELSGNENWQYRYEVETRVQNLKVFTGYNKIQGDFFEKPNPTTIDVEMYIKENKTDLFCIDANNKLYKNLMNQVPVREMPCCVNIPFLAFPKYWDPNVRKGL